MELFYWLYDFSLSYSCWAVCINNLFTLLFLLITRPIGRTLYGYMYNQVIWINKKKITKLLNLPKYSSPSPFLYNLANAVCIIHQILFVVCLSQFGCCLYTHYLGRLPILAWTRHEPANQWDNVSLLCDYLFLPKVTSTVPWLQT